MTLKMACSENLEEIVSTTFESELGNRYFKDNKERIKSVIQKGIEKNEIYILVEEDKLIGFIQLKFNGAFEKYPFIHFLIVKEEYRSKGIGSKLVALSEKMLMKGSDKYFLMVGKWNYRGIEFYKNNGFRVIGELEHFYKNDEVEVLMEKRITDI